MSYVNSEIELFPTYKKFLLDNSVLEYNIGAYLHDLEVGYIFFKMIERVLSKK